MNPQLLFNEQFEYLNKNNPKLLSRFFIMENRHKRVNPEQDALVHIVARRDKPFLEERFIDSFKGTWHF